MQLQAFQLWERRDENDNIIRPGAYGKYLPLANSQNTGILDYIGNNLDVLYNGLQASGVDFDENGNVTVSGEIKQLIDKISDDTLATVNKKTEQAINAVNDLSDIVNNAENVLTNINNSKTEALQSINEQANAYVYLKRKTVDILPAPSEADINTIYVKSVTDDNGDKTYSAYFLIDDKFVLFGTNNMDKGIRDYLDTLVPLTDNFSF